MKFTQIPANTFQNIQMNAGVLVDAFNPATMEIGNILGATSGGNNFTDSPTFKDFGEDIDNCPKNTKELKKLEDREVKITGTFATVNASNAKRLVGTADIDPQDSTHIVPRKDVSQDDFEDFWWVGDYSDVNDGSNAGYMAIHIMNALSTGGFQLQTTDKDKGKFAFEFTAHYSIADQNTVPYEMYVKQGTGISISLNKSSTSIDAGSNETLTATTVPAGQTVNWVSSNRSVATVTTGGKVTGVAAGSAVISASVTVDGATKTANCNVTINAVQ